MTDDEAEDIARGSLRQGFYSCVGTWGSRSKPEIRDGVVVERYAGVDVPGEARQYFDTRTEAMAFCIAQNVKIAARAAQ